MSIRRFKITYRSPTNNEVKVKIIEPKVTPDCGLTAEDIAEDYAYTLADKGWFTVEEIKGDK